MTGVRVKTGTPTAEDFRDRNNSPIVIDDSTDIPYYLDGSTVTPLQGTAGYRYITTTATLDFPSTAANAVSALNVTLTGVTAADNNTVILGPPSTLEAGLVFSGYVVSDDTVQVRIHNGSGGVLDPASATWRVSAFI